MRAASQQLLFPEVSPLNEALALLKAGSLEERGAIYTRREVVDFILDLVGYTSALPLWQMRLLEPSFGGGDFLLVAIERLMKAYVRHAVGMANAWADLKDAVRAVELHARTYKACRLKVVALLESEGIAPSTADALAGAWLAEDDFLLCDLEGTFTHIVGNPPYVRQELIPDVLWAEYRALFSTIYDRADIYVPFIEKSLRALRPGGRLSFICADRWMKNRYGRPLRELVSSRFHMVAYVDMVDTPAFHSEVAAYPAITVIANEPAGPTRVLRRPAIDRDVLTRAASAIRGEGADPTVYEMPHVASNAGPWVLEEFDGLEALRSIEDRFRTIEEAGCRVGIGVATGADKAFIAPYEALDVEDSRKLPLVMTRDIQSGVVAWRGFGVVNPFETDGSLADFGRYPRFARYMEARREELCQRHVSRRNPNAWYRTIDRIYPELASAPKLLIPDIKGQAHIVFEGGQLYPHHNLYFVTADSWDLRALQAVLRSAVVHAFISMYSTKMRGGYMRFQAQYLRLIRLPLWQDVSDTLRATLVAAAESPDQDTVDNAVFELYGLSPKQRQRLRRVHV